MISLAILAGSLPGSALPENTRPETLRPASDANIPAQGMFLVATRDLTGSGFSESVILLVQHDDFGTLGLIINKRTNLKPAELLSEIEGIAGLDGHLYVGGPVATEGIMMLVRSDTHPNDAVHVFADVYASGSQKLLGDIVKRRNSADHVRLYAGHAGWLPGQLDAEIERGSWVVVPAKESHIFSSDPESIWKQLSPESRPFIVRQGGQLGVQRGIQREAEPGGVGSLRL